jgi:hypothetical protein
VKERLALWDKSYEELAFVLPLDNRSKEQQLHISGSNVKCLSNKEAVTENIKYLQLDFWLPTYVLNLVTYSME